MEYKPFDDAEITDLIRRIIAQMRWDGDPNFDETPDRFKKWILQEQGLSKSECREKSKEHLSKTFPTKNQQMIVVGPSKVFSLCPHHLQVIEYDVWIGYIAKGKAVGLSKLARVPDTFGNYPFIQEEFTEEIADCVYKNLDANGVMVVVKGIHNCMRVRGVKQPEAVTMTSALKGVFDKPPKGKDPRSEFLKLVEMSGDK